jgi:hypothetical protein
MERSTKLAALFLILIASVGGIFGINMYLNRDKTATLTIEFAPMSSEMTINGQKSKAGKRKYIPGTYEVVVSKTGFATKKSKVTISKGTPQYVGLVLESNSKDTQNWFSTHPKDEKLAEKITSLNFDQKSDEALDIPIVAKLPFVGPGELYRIDFTSLSSTKRAIITISYKDEDSKADALNWITNQGFKLADYDIVYTFVEPPSDVEVDSGDGEPLAPTN